MSRLKTLGLVLLIFVPFVLVELLLGSRGAAPSRERDHTSLNPNNWGTMALLETCQRLGMPVERWGAPFREGFLRPGETLLMLDPQQVPRPEEFRALWAAVREGATAIVSVSAVERQLPPMLQPRRQEKQWSPRAAADLTLAYLNLQRTAEGEAARLTTPEEDQRGPLAGVTQVEVPSGERVRLGVDGARLREAVEEFWGKEQPLPKREKTGAPETLLGDTEGAVLLRCPLGKGAVYVVSEVETFSNEHLDAADNAVLAVNLVTAAGRPGRVVFDEYHHGLLLTSAAPGHLNYGAFSAAMWLALLALAVFMSGYFWRLGRAAPASRPPRRSALEHVAAIASLYQAAEAGGLAVSLAGGEFRRRLRERWGLPASTSDETLVGAAEARGVSPSRLAELLRRLAAVQEEDRLGDAEVVRLIREISEVEEQALGSR